MVQVNRTEALDASRAAVREKLVTLPRRDRLIETFANHLASDAKVLDEDEETGAKRFLYNRTVDGQEEIFDDLIFHGGDGMTLEMRMFSEPDLRRRLAEAGFGSVRVYADQVPEFGILWPMDWAVPIAARVIA